MDGGRESGCGFLMVRAYKRRCDALPATGTAPDAPFAVNPRLEAPADSRNPPALAALKARTNSHSPPSAVFFFGGSDELFR